MRFFKERKQPVRACVQSYPPELYEPVIRASICTGEQVACMRHRETGEIRELTLIRDRKDLEAFCRTYRVKAGEIKTIY